MDRPFPVRWFEGAIENREVLLLQVRRPLDRIVLVDKRRYVLDLLIDISELVEGERHGLIDDLEQPASDQLLVLDERDVRFHAGRIAIHHEADGARRRKDGCLRISESVFAPDRIGVVPNFARGGEQIARDVSVFNPVRREPVHLYNPEHRLPVFLEPLERTDLA